MPSYDGFSQAAPAASSSDYRVQALLGGLQWSGPAITYSFPDADALWSPGNPSYSDFHPLTEAERNVVRQAMAEWASVIAVPIVEVADDVNVGDIRIMGGWGASPTQSGGNFPGQQPYAGDVGYASQNITLSTAAMGSYDYFVVLHELGHALGLKHPHEGSVTLPAGEDNMTASVMSYFGYPGYFPTTPMVYDIRAMQAMYGVNTTTRAGDDVYAFDDSRPYDETIWDAGGTDTIRYTGSRSTLMGIAPGGALTLGQQVDEYGNRVPNVWIAEGVTIENVEGGSGNDYILGNDVANRIVGNAGDDSINGGRGDDVLVGGAGADRFEFGQWDTGTDTIEDFAADDRIMIGGIPLLPSMTAGDGSSVGRFGVQYQEGGGYTTLFIGTNTTPGPEVIVRVAGEYSASQFTIDGQFIALNGSAPGPVPGDTHAFIGTAGTDTITMAGAHTQYSVTPSSLSGPEGTFTLSSIERVRFADNFAIALDVSGHAGQAYRLYQAAFDRAPDLGGLGYQMNDLDKGYSLSQVAANFIASPEFQSKYGTALDDAAFVTLLYQHVLHRAPQQFEVDYHVNDELHAGYSRADVLTFFSESPEDQANVIGQIGNGMLYVPVG